MLCTQIFHPGSGHRWGKSPPSLVHVRTHWTPSQTPAKAVISTGIGNEGSVPQIMQNLSCFTALDAPHHENNTCVMRLRFQPACGCSHRGVPPFPATQPQRPKDMGVWGGRWKQRLLWVPRAHQPTILHAVCLWNTPPSTKTSTHGCVLILQVVFPCDCGDKTFQLTSPADLSAVEIRSFAHLDSTCSERHANGAVLLPRVPLHLAGISVTPVSARRWGQLVSELSSQENKPVLY